MFVYPMPDFLIVNVWSKILKTHCSCILMYSVIFLPADRYYAVLMPLLTFVFPAWSQVYFFGTDPWTAWYISLFRWVLIVNGTWCVNSVAHSWGNKPYDRFVSCHWHYNQINLNFPRQRVSYIKFVLCFN